jgi:hypothetical protein
MDRDVLMREAFGVREACFRFAMKPLKTALRAIRSPRFKSTKSEMLPHSFFRQVRLAPGQRKGILRLTF